MLKKTENRAAKIRSFVRSVPYFRLENLLPIDDDRKYLKILLFRMNKTGELSRIMKGMYVHRDYIVEKQIRNEIDSYYEFLACTIFPGAYLSLEYVLSEYGILSENSFAFSVVSAKKTYQLKNSFAFFSNHSIKDELLVGYEMLRKNGFLIRKASKAKALFDFLYLRKNILTGTDSVKALRLNLEAFAKSDWAELAKYIKLEKSKKMREFYSCLR